MTERFGADVARPFFERFGGQQLYLPLKPRHDHIVSLAVGRSVLSWLIERFGAGKLDVPNALSSRFTAQNLRIRQLIMDGTYSEAEIARLVGCGMRSVRRQRAAMRDAGMRVPETDFAIRKRVNAERRKRVLSLLLEGCTRAEIIRELGATDQQIRGDEAHLRTMGRLPPKRRATSAGTSKRGKS